MSYPFYSMRHANQNIQGTAIFMALLIIAIVSAIAITLSRFQQLDIRRTNLMLTSEQAYLYAQGVEYWARGRLILELQRNQAANATQPITTWPIVLPPTRIADGQGTIMGSIQDAQGLFNLNNLAKLPETSANQSQVPSTINPSSKPGDASGVEISSPSQELFIRLLSSLGLSLSIDQQKKLIAAISAWVSAGDKKIPDAFDQSYAQMNPPYRSPHALMVSISELRTVAGVTPSIYNRLAPYITALPSTKTSFTIQHAPLLLQQAFQSNQQNQAQGSGGNQSSLGNYFLLRTDVYLQDQHLILYSMLQRSSQSNQSLVTVLWRSLGTQ